MVGRHSRDIKVTLLLITAALSRPRAFPQANLTHPTTNCRFNQHVGWVKPTAPRHRFRPQEQSTLRTKITILNVLA